MKKYELNRKKYLELKKYDHNQMQQYLNAVYENGYRAGEKSAPAKVELPDMAALEEELKNVKGVGGAKALAICETVKAFLERKVAGNNETNFEVSGE